MDSANSEHLEDSVLQFEDSSKFRSCLVCGVQTANSHMGIDACRACAVFYKRTLTGVRPLKCKGGLGHCLLTDPTTSCRKCRFERFASIMEKAYGSTLKSRPNRMEEENETIKEEDLDSVSLDRSPTEVKDIKPIIECNRMIDYSTQPSTSFIDYSTFYEIETASGVPLLERIKRGYSKFCLMRKIGEMSMKPPTIPCKNGEFRPDELRFFPATITNTIQFGRVFVESLYDFAYSAFDDFRELSMEERRHFLKNSFSLVGSISGTYRAAHYFPNDETGFVSYLTTISHESAAVFFRDESNESHSEVNREHAIRLIREGLSKGNRTKKESFKRANLSETEFIALLGLAFWNLDQDVPTEQLTTLANKNRERIMQELHSYYYGKGQQEYAVRIGELFCLLITMQKAVSELAEEIQLYRLLNVFDESIFSKECKCDEPCK